MEIKPNKLKKPVRTVTQKTIDAILKDIKRGSPNKHAALANGISEEHFYNMVRQGICDVHYGDLDTMHARMVQSLQKIEMEEIIGCKQDIRISDKGHKGAEWILEHSYWRHFCGDAKLMELAEEFEREKGRSKNETSNS